MENFLQNQYKFWTNIYIFWTFSCRNSYCFRRGSVRWIRIESNVFDHWSSVNYFCTRIVYWLHWSCEIWLIYDFLFYFWCLRNFLWWFCWLSNILINRRLPSPHSCSSLTYSWFLLWNFISFLGSCSLLLWLEVRIQILTHTMSFQ